MIQVGFSTSKAWYSRVIRWATGSQVSHTFLLLPEALFGMDMVLEASMLGWTMRTYESFQNSGNVPVKLVTPKVDIMPQVVHAITWLDTVYDYLGLVGMLWVEIGRLCHRHWRNPLHLPHALFCSEANTMILQAAGLVPQLDASATSPQDLLDALDVPDR